jgi:hypothetical protein
MNFFRLTLLIVAGCCLLRSPSLFADDITSPFGPNKQFSADMVINPDKPNSMTQKIFSDSGKIRTEINASGMQMVSIVRPDLKKIYSVMVAQKMVMEMPFDPDKVKQMSPAAMMDGKTDLVGPDTVDGEACTKYKITTKDNKIYYYWIDATTKVPVKMAADDDSVTIVWKNYQAGPQAAALFEVPADYQVIPMPSMPPTTVPGGPGSTGGDMTPPAPGGTDQ